MSSGQVGGARALGTALGAIVLLLAASGPALAASPTLMLSPARGLPGASFAATYTPASPGCSTASVTFSWDGLPPSGSFLGSAGLGCRSLTVRLTVPAARPGSHTIYAFLTDARGGVASGTVASAEFVIDGAASPTPVPTATPPTPSPSSLPSSPPSADPSPPAASRTPSSVAARMTTPSVEPSPSTSSPSAATYAPAPSETSAIATLQDGSEDPAAADETLNTTTSLLLFGGLVVTAAVGGMLLIYRLLLITAARWPVSLNERPKR